MLIEPGTRVLVKDITEEQGGAFKRVRVEVISEEPLLVEEIQRFRGVQRLRHFCGLNETIGGSILSYLYSLTGTEVAPFDLSLKDMDFKRTKKTKKKLAEIVKSQTEKGLLKARNLETEDVEAIFIYTTEASNKSVYRKVSDALLKRNIDSFSVVKSYVIHFLSALRKLEPVKDMVLYRGISIEKETVWINDYTKTKIGDTIIWDCFSSTSTIEDTAKLFAKKGGFLFEIHGEYYGYRISSFSEYPDESNYH